MPEGHTIHRIAKDHQKWFAGQKLLVSSPQGRFESGASKVSGKKLVEVFAHGKHLFYRWPRNTILHVHLGLYGKFRVHNNPPPEPRGAVRVRMIGAKKSFDLNGPNCCELIGQNEFKDLEARLGEDPLRSDACPENVWTKLNHRRSSIGSLLLDQSVIAGIGNIYRSELLFLLGIHPRKPANEITRDTFDQMWELATELLQIGVKYNRIITTGHQNQSRLGKLKAIERLNIYKRTHCPTCNASIETMELANRRVFACNRCQRI